MGIQLFGDTIYILNQVDKEGRFIKYTINDDKSKKKKNVSKSMLKLLNRAII